MTQTTPIYGFISPSIAAATIYTIGSALDQAPFLQSAVRHQITVAPGTANAGTVALTARYYGSSEFEVVNLDGNPVIADLSNGTTTFTDIFGLVAEWKLTPAGANGTWTVVASGWGDAGVQNSQVVSLINSVALLDSNVRSYEIIDLLGGSLTLSNEQAQCSALFFVGAAAGSTVTFPSSADDLIPRQQLVSNLFSVGDLTVESQTGGFTATVMQDMFVILSVLPGVGVYNVNDYAASQARSHSQGPLVYNADLVLGYSDLGRLCVMDVGIANTVTVPVDTNIDMTNNAIVYVMQMGAGNTTIVGEVGVTLVGDATMAINESRTLRRDGTSNTWYISN